MVFSAKKNIRFSNLSWAVWTGLLILFYWLAESVADVFLFSGQNLFEAFFPQNSHEIWMRLSIVAGIIAYGLFVAVQNARLKKINQSLKETENKFNAIFNTADEAIGISKKGVHIAVNESYLALFGFSSPDELKNTPIIYLIAPDERNKIVEYTALRSQGNEVERSYQTKGLKRDGTVFEMGVQVFNFQQDGDIYNLTILKDNSVQKKIEEALSESEKRWQFAIEGSNDGLFDWNIPENRLFLSTRWKAILGYDESELENDIEVVSGLVHPEEAETFRSELEAIEKGKIGNIYEKHRLRCKDQTYKWILFRGKVTEFDKSGIPVRVIGTTTDLHAQNLIPHQLAEKDSDHSIFINGIEVSWDKIRGICNCQGLPVALLWVDSTLAGLMSGLAGMVGPERFSLALQAGGRDSVESDWLIISTRDSFAEGFKIISQTAVAAGWGNWQMISLDEANKVCTFRAYDNWEGQYQKTLNVCWGSSMLAGKFAGYCSKYFKTNCWATQTRFTAKGDPFDEFLVSPSSITIEQKIDQLLVSDLATQADMAVAIQNLRKSEELLKLEIDSRKKTEIALTASELKFRSMFEQHNVVMLLIDPETMLIQDANQAACNFYLYSRNELKGLELSKINAYSPDELQEEKLNAEKSNRNFYIFKHKLANGEIRTVEVHSSSVSESGRTLLFFVILDITNRIAVEKALEQSENKWRTLVHALPDRISLFDCNGYYLFLNHFSRGFPEKNILGEHFSEFIPTESLPVFMEAFDRTIKNGTSELFVEKGYGDNGEIRFFESYITPVFENEILSHVLMIDRDITEKFIAEKALVSSENRFRAMAEISPMAVFIIRNSDKTIDYINPGITRLFGYTSDDLKTADDWMNLAYPDENYRQKVYNIVLADIELQAKGKSEPNPFEVKIQCKDGSHRIVSSSMSLSGDFIWVFGQDLTEQYHKQDEVKISQRRAQSLLKISQHETESLKELIDLALDEAIALSESEIGYIYYYSEETQQFTLHAWSKEVMPQCVVLNPQTTYDLEKTGFWGEAVRQRKPIILNEFQDMNPLKKGTPDGHVVLKRFMTIPVFSGNQIVAVVGVANKVQPYSDFDVSELQLMMDSIWKIYEKKEIALELKFSEQRLQHLIDSASDFTYQVILNNEIPEFSIQGVGVLKVTGYSPEEFKQDTDLWRKIIFPEDTERFISFLADILSGKMSAPVEHRVIHKNGSIKWVENILSFRQNEDPDKKIADGLITDISLKKQAEISILESGRSYFVLFNSISDGIFIQDENGMFLDVNEGVEKMFGFSREEVIGKTLEYLAEPGKNNSDYFFHKIKSSFFTGSDSKFEFWAKRKSGEVFPTEVALGKGKYFGLDVVIAMVRDITDRKKDEGKMNEQAYLLEHAHDGIILLDLQNKITYANKGCESIFGWNSEELIGKDPVALLYNNEEYKNKREEVMTHLKNKGNWQGILKKVKKTGEVVVLDDRWTYLKNPMGQPTGILVISSDITEKYFLEKQFLRAQRLESLGTLASGVAHDLNNVLTPILMSVEMMGKDISKERLGKIVGTIEKSALRGKNILHQMLTFARGGDEDREVFNPVNLLKEIEHLIKETFPRSIGIQLEIENGLKGICSNPTQFHQVLMNLCVNARDAMPDGGQLTIRCSNILVSREFALKNLGATEGDYVLIRVSDTGTGIPQNVIEKIFEPFFTTKEVGKGTGLGLSTVHSIVKNNGGFITVSSSPGSGTDFSIYLPAFSEYEKKTDQITSIEFLEGNQETVLIVEDEATLRDMAKDILELHNYRVLTAENGNEGISVLLKNQQTVKIVITDIMMPKMDGKKLIYTIRKIKSNVKIIAISGLIEAKDLRKDSIGEIQGFLAKPFTMDTLLSTIQSVLKNETKS